MAFTTRSPRILVLVTLLASMTRHVVHGCRCVRVAPNERAEYIRESDWIDLYAIATFANETSDDYSDYQDTVFVLKEVVYNTDPKANSLVSSRSIPVERCIGKSPPISGAAFAAFRSHGRTWGKIFFFP